MSLPVTASTKGHEPVLEKSLGTSTSKLGGLDSSQPQTGVKMVKWLNMEAANMSSPRLLYRD